MLYLCLIFFLMLKRERERDHFLMLAPRRRNEGDNERPTAKHESHNNILPAGMLFRVQDPLFQSIRMLSKSLSLRSTLSFRMQHNLENSLVLSLCIELTDAQPPASKKTTANTRIMLPRKQKQTKTRQSCYYVSCDTTEGRSYLLRRKVLIEIYLLALDS